MHAARVRSLERDILPVWVSKGLRGERARGRFIDIGTPESYRAAERFFARPNLGDST
jgi:D-glycero-alpha-D-manno-heptose 1-phosphate guanylyltransferase